MSLQPTAFGAITTQQNDLEVPSYGGRTVRLLAGGTLLLGDVVHTSAAGTVNKSTTNANYSRFVGVVVGGDRFDQQGRINYDPTLVGQQAALVGENVIVQIDGIVPIRSDGAILATSIIIPDATVAGECDVAGANPGWTLGLALAAIPDNTVGPMMIRHAHDEA